MYKVDLHPTKGEASPYAEAIQLAASNADDGDVSSRMELAVTSGDPRAMYAIATWYLAGEYGYPCSDERALSLLHAAAQAGVTEAMYDLGVSFELARGVPSDCHKAFYWYLRAAIRGEADAVMQVANCYASGSGIELDLVSALAWYEAAEALGVDAGEAERFRQWLRDDDGETSTLPATSTKS
ncbi:MAG: tetratricopeptide repeat protein [Myxococcota bacterium]